MGLKQAMAEAGDITDAAFGERCEFRVDLRRGCIRELLGESQPTSKFCEHLPIRTAFAVAWPKRRAVGDPSL